MRTVLLNAIVKEIKRGQLLDLVNTTGDVLLSGLKKLEVYHCSKLLVRCTYAIQCILGYPNFDYLNPRLSEHYYIHGIIHVASYCGVC